jgi:ABC-2 type transport system ATP-binding protein
MFAEDAIYKNMGTLANLRFQARLHGLPKANADAVLRRVGLADQARQPANKLSPSLQRRLGFGRAILHEPNFLLLIEPFNRCDKTTVDLLTAQIQDLADEGTAILVLSADASRLAPVCDLLYELQNGDIIERMTQPRQEEALRQPFKIPVKTEDTVLLVNPAEVLYADTGEGRTFLVTAEGRLPTQFTLTELEERLKRSGFFRAHRSYLVNLQHVREVIPFTRNSFSLRLDDPAGTQIPLSKSAAGELKELLGY